MQKKICVFGGSSLYRLPIYNLMAEKLNCDFYISVDDPSMGIKTFDFKKLTNYKGLLYPHKIIGNVFWLKGALKLFKKDYDIYVLGGPFCLSYWIIILLSKFSDKVITSWSHGLYGKEPKVRKAIKVLYYKQFSMNFVYNNRAVELMSKCGINNMKITCVGNSLDTDDDLKIRKNLHESNALRRFFNNDYPILIFVGRLTKSKRLDLVIDSMSVLRDKGVFVNFFVIGEDVDGVNLYNIAKLKGLEPNVYLYGPCYDNEVLGNFYYNADLCVSPGNVGLTAISSMTFGCPVLSHNNFNMQGPEFEAIKPGLTGDFFYENDIDDLSNKIQNWIESVDKIKREKIRNNAFKEVDNHWNIYSEEKSFENAFNKL